MKKIVLLIALMGFLFYSENVQAAQIPVEEAVAIANQEIGWEHFKLTGPNAVNNMIWDKYEVLVKGSPDSVPTSDQDYVNGEPRYLGYTPLDELMPNPEFPPDDPASTLINNWKWLIDPWSNNSLGIWWSPTWDDKPENEPYIRIALSKKFNEDPKKIDPNANPLFNYTNPPETGGWYEVTKILQPRTSVTPGLGRMWHKWNNANWYITVIIPSVLPPDIEVTQVTNDSPVPTETEQVASAVYKNNSKETHTFEALFYIADKVISTESITLAAGQSVTKNYAWTSPDAQGQIVLKAEAKPVQNEVNSDNNIKTLIVDVEEVAQPVEPASLGCQEAASQTYNWSVGYHWTTKSSYTDKDGKTQTRTHHQYKTVPYSETLQANLAVNTKQGIANGGRESRGAWEIIPYAKKKGLNPNEVTRSGYGFEVKVVTNYNTDWETKVPAGASRKGGSYSGPDKAVADFYDTKGKFVKRVNMVPTQGKAGDKNITWELPQEKYTFQDGTTIYERKHYTDINVSDGKYQVKVTVSGAGKSDLCLIQKKYVTIYGDMYEDSYTRVSTQDE